jgi:hypothetical protein
LRQSARCRVATRVPIPISESQKRYETPRSPLAA